MKQHSHIADPEAEGDRLLAAGELKDAVILFQEALEHYQTEERKADQGRIHRKLGSLFSSVTDTENGLENYLQALDIFRELQLKEETVRSQLDLGFFYQGVFQFANAIEYYSSALAEAKQLANPQLIAESHYSLGNCYNWMDRLADASTQLKLALEIEPVPDTLRMKMLGSLGIVSYKENRSAEALEYFRESLKLNEQTVNSPAFRMSVTKSMGMAYLLENDTENAIRCMDEAMAAANERTDWGTLTTIHEHYSKIYEKVGDFKRALEHLQKRIDTADILQNENVKMKTRELQKKFDIAESQREKEIYRLKNIDLVEANEEISRQKSELQTKNRHITDSIFYAGRLQRAVLPSEKGLGRWLPDSFIYFEPKDIVSGDFYWFSQRNNRLMVAAVDCTGHGVPGALISMIGSNILNELVNKEGLTEPAAILQDMNRKMKRLLQNSESGATANDGMDLSLCSIDLSTCVLHFAGAHRPLIFVRNGILHEVKGSHVSIGGFSDFDAEFEEHRIDIEDGDAFYIFSDGYADQFGGPNNRKYMNRNFKELLLRTSHLSMTDQHEAIANEHRNWRNTNEQIDDILVIGFRP